MARRRRKTVSCKTVTIKAQRRTVCRDAKGRIVGSHKVRRGKRLRVLKAVCPKRYNGHKVYQAAGGGCYIKPRGKKARFVPKRRAA